VIRIVRRAASGNSVVSAKGPRGAEPAYRALGWKGTGVERPRLQRATSSGVVGFVRKWSMGPEPPVPTRSGYWSAGVTHCGDQLTARVHAHHRLQLPPAALTPCQLRHPLVGR
jgi:hypothetical protein